MPKKSSKGRKSRRSNRRSPRKSPRRTHKKRSSSPKRRGRRSRMKGGASSNYVGLFHASSPTNVQDLSKLTLQNINKAPVFNPLQKNTVFPTGTSGVIPNGPYYMECAQASKGLGLINQFGRGRKTQKIKSMGRKISSPFKRTWRKLSGKSRSKLYSPSPRRRSLRWSPRRSPRRSPIRSPRWSPRRSPRWSPKRTPGMNRPWQRRF